MPVVSSHDPTAPLPSDLSKLNVSQLKALCRERRIVGFSKLGKAALISKLRALTLPTSAQNTRSQVDSSLLDSGPPHSPPHDPPVNNRVTVAVPGAMGPPSLPNPLDKVPGAHIPQISVASGFSSSLQPSPCPSGGRGKRHSPSVSGSSAAILKRVSSEISQSQAHADPSAKRQKITASSALQAAASALHFINFARPSDDLGVVTVDPPVSASSCSEIAPIIKESVTQVMATPGRRFKPLTITRPPSASPCYRNRNEAQLPSCVLVDKSANVTAQPILFWHLDFPAHPEFPLLSPITFPPPLSQRRLIQHWAIILGGLSGRERFQCCLVSRLIRYAVYSSAYYKLSRDFSGRRLSLALERSGSALMINFWPYLRRREQEVSERKSAVMSSFLRSAFQGPTDIISARLWASPENEKQLVVALRFLLTRLWFALSSATEYGRNIRTSWLHDTITDVAEIVEGEIWSVTCSTISGYVKVFHVLEATCEVLGLAEDTYGDEKLRSDWAGYMEQRKTNPLSTSPLRDAMRWADHAEFDHGVSWHWLRRTAQMGAEGAALRMIAERYTLACVVGNGLSGRWMSAPQMAQEFAGLTQRKTLPAPTKTYNVNLFLPAHHHVESVHLTARGRRPLHPALAVVQTPSREYYVLRDNGLEVGCEEEGVASVWMRILGCDARGEPDGRAQSGVSFEELKGYIENL